MNDGNNSIPLIKYPHSLALSRKCQCLRGRRDCSPRHPGWWLSLNKELFSCHLCHAPANQRPVKSSVLLACICSAAALFSSGDSLFGRCQRPPDVSATIPETCRIIKPSAHHCGQRENRPWQGLIQLQTRQMNNTSARQTNVQLSRVDHLACLRRSRDWLPPIRVSKQKSLLFCAELQYVCTAREILMGDSSGLFELHRVDFILTRKAVFSPLYISSLASCRSNSYR